MGGKYKRKIATSILNHALEQEVTRNQALPGNNMRGSNGLVSYAPEETDRRPTTFRRPREQAGLSHVRHPKEAIQLRTCCYRFL